VIIGYNDNHKSYMLVDIDTNKASFSRDVVGEEVGPFHTSPKFKITQQPMVDKDSSVKLKVVPLEGGGEILSKRSLLGQ